MSGTSSPFPTAKSPRRWFYSTASLIMLVFMVIGFHFFYLQGKAYPGRPLAPPIRSLIIAHGCLMTVWMLLAVAQPLLVAKRRRRLHMKLGVLGVALAVVIVIVGLRIGVESTRWDAPPPGVLKFGLSPKAFMAVPILSILVFGLFVLVGVLNRRRPEVHRPMMLMASVTMIGAALGRMAPLNELYAGTWWELAFSAFFMQVIFGAILLVAKCMVSQSFDRWFATAFAAMTAACLTISLVARTQAWDQFATYLLR